MPGLIERRKEYLDLIRRFTLEQGYFTVSDIADEAGVPRSTAQDWIARLMDEGCVVQKEGKRGRAPARFQAVSVLPRSACRRIFTTIDGDRVEIYHECLSSACAAFCEFHHRQAGGILSRVSRDGTLLRECASLGEAEAEIGLYPSPAVGVVGLRKVGDEIVQRIRCIGGPAYSLTDMMGVASGVERVDLRREGVLVEGEVTTRALRYVAIGIDDTDSREGGATFALALALLQQVSSLPGVIPIGHHVAMLYPDLREKTAGNSCSFIEVAADPESCQVVRDRSLRFLSDEALSPEWGLAVKTGFTVPEELREYGNRVRRQVVTRKEASAVAARCGIDIEGGRGVIGAVAALSFIGLDTPVLLDPTQEIRSCTGG